MQYEAAVVQDLLPAKELLNFFLYVLFCTFLQRFYTGHVLYGQPNSVQLIKIHCLKKKLIKILLKAHKRKWHYDGLNNPPQKTKTKTIVHDRPHLAAISTEYRHRRWPPPSAPLPLPPCTASSASRRPPCQRSRTPHVLLRCRLSLPRSPPSQVVLASHLVGCYSKVSYACVRFCASIYL